MERHTVNIELHAGGGSQVAGEVGKVGKATTDLIVNVKKFGNLFGELGRNLGSFAQNLLKGGVWGIAQSLVEMGVNAFNKWRDSGKEAAEAAAKAMKDSIDKQQKCVENYMAAVKKAYDTENTLISRDLQLMKQRIDSTHSLTKATLELEKAFARMNGDKAGMAAIDRRMEEEADRAQRAKLEADIKAAERRKANADKEISKAQRGVTAEERVIKNAREKKRDGEQKVIENLGVFDDEYTELRKYRASQEVRDLDENAKNARKKKSEYNETIRLAKDARLKAEADIDAAERALKAFDKEVEARKINASVDAQEAEDSARKKEEEDVRKFNAEKARLEKEIAAERKALEREVAAEREKRERELHKRRMDDLREEIAKQKEASAPLRTVAASAQSEFDRAFAMYRDPSRAAAEIGEEKDYQNDLDRLHRDARRYGGKWRIDELSRLMSAGDTQGVTDTLKEWRKSKGFTPEVEAMVRASAAEQTKTTVEDELRKIETNVADMGAHLKAMSGEQTGKLGEIAGNTAGLSTKLDQLLQVKG